MAKDRFDDDVYNDGGAREARSSMGGRTAIMVPTGLNMFKPKKTGTMVLDIIPYIQTEQRERFREKLRFGRGPGFPYRERTYFVHYNIGINEDAYTCTAATFGRPCPVCDEIARLGNSPHPEAKQQIKTLKAKERQLILVYDRETPDKGLQLWEVSYHTFFANLGVWLEGVPERHRDEYRMYWHPTKGKTLRVTCSEKPSGEGRTFTNYGIHGMDPRESPIPAAVLDHDIDLDALPVEMPYDKFKAILTGLAEDDADGGETGGPENPEPPRPAQRPAPARNGASPQAQQPAPPRRETAPPPRRPEPEPAPASYTVNDAVQFDWRGEMVRGVVEKVNDESGWADVRIDGRDKPIRLDFSELSPAGDGDDTFPLPTGDEPEPQPEPEPASRPAPRPTARATQPAKPPTTKPAGGWDDPDDNAPFAAPSPPPPPAPKKGGKR